MRKEKNYVDFGELLQKLRKERRVNRDRSCRKTRYNWYTRKKHKTLGEKFRNPRFRYYI